MEMMKNPTMQTVEKKHGKYQAEKKKSIHSRETCGGRDRSGSGKSDNTGDDQDRRAIVLKCSKQHYDYK